MIILPPETTRTSCESLNVVAIFAALFLTCCIYVLNSGFKASPNATALAELRVLMDHLALWEKQPN